ncbi:MAG TPA: cobyrinate a,c-diamide synthase [Devosia sp.]|nr:cobyrinate a,c-diamide synthase [Devosia sp.]
MSLAAPPPMRSANGLVVAAPRTGSGKTLVTLGLIAALQRRGLVVAPAKTGPDYIDRAILARVAGSEAINLDPWAMREERLRALAYGHAAGADLLLVEGVMGLFDGAADGRGSTADLAAALALPVILVVDAERQGQSIAALVAGFAGFRRDVEIAGIIVNRVATTRHERLLRAALDPLGLPVLGMLPRRDTLVLPDRHLGLVLPEEVAGFDAIVAAAGATIEEYVDLNRLLSLSREIASPKAICASEKKRLPPLGQRIAIARDAAFAFIYPHLLADWRAAGAELGFFSPLANESPLSNSDSVFLPGGYPELHGLELQEASRFHAGLLAARDRGALIYGECGGYMVLGEQLTDRTGRPFKMAGLLPLRSSIHEPRRTLGYRHLTHRALGSWPADLLGHEFHYSSGPVSRGTPLFTATDALGEPLPPMGMVDGRVMGSYAHVIDVA